MKTNFILFGCVESEFISDQSEPSWLEPELELKRKRPQAEPSRAENPSAWLGLITYKFRFYTSK